MEQKPRKTYSPKYPHRKTGPVKLRGEIGSLILFKMDDEPVFRQKGKTSDADS